MGNAPGFVLIAVVVAVIAFNIVRANRRRRQHDGVIEEIAAVLGGKVDKQHHAVGTYGQYAVDAHLFRGDDKPADALVGDVRPLTIDQLTIQLRSPAPGGGIWYARRDPSWPGKPNRVEFMKNPVGLMVGARSMMARFSIAELDEAGRQRLAAAGLLDAIEALGDLGSGYLPRVQRAAAPQLPPGMVAKLAAQAPAGTPPSAAMPGAAFTVTVQLAGPDLSVEEFRRLLDRTVRIAEIDAAHNH